MPWLQLSVITNRDFTAEAENALLQLGASSITYRDADDVPILEPAPGETPIWERSIVTGLFDTDIESENLLAKLSLALDGHDCSIHSEILEDQNWSRAWMAHFKPMPFGERLWIVPSHLEPPNNNTVNLRLDPGLAFGTGTHPTTALCLQWLDQHISQQNTVLDYGCGSGILAIAALMLGVKTAVGVDIDPQAIEASISNATNNAVAAQLDLALVKDFQMQQFDIVMANILSGPLTELAPLLAQCTTVGGDIVLSGILCEQANSIRTVYAEYFDMDDAVTQGDWAMLHGCRK